MNEHEKYLVEQLAKSVTWRLGCRELFGKEMENIDLDEIRDIIYRTGRETLFRSRTFALPSKADNFEDFCKFNILRTGIAEDFLTEKMIAQIFEKELKDAYDKSCVETNG